MPMFLPNGINISDVDMIALRDVLNDPEEWVRTLISEKVARSRRAMRSTWVDRLIDDPAVSVIPSNEDLLLDTISKRADYKNRAERDANQTARD